MATSLKYSSSFAYASFVYAHPSLYRMWNHAGVIMVILMSPHWLSGRTLFISFSSCMLDTDFLGSCRSLEPAMTLSPGITFLSFSIRLTTSGWYSLNMLASASCSRVVPSNSSQVSPQKRVRVNSPSVTARKPRSRCSLTTSSTACFSTAGRPASSAEMPWSRILERMSRRGCGRRREPMCSALKGGAWWDDMFAI